MLTRRKALTGTVAALTVAAGTTAALAVLSKPMFNPAAWIEEAERLSYEVYATTDLRDGKRWLCIRPPLKPVPWESERHLWHWLRPDKEGTANEKALTAYLRRVGPHFVHDDKSAVWLGRRLPRRAAS